MLQQLAILLICVKLAIGHSLLDNLKTIDSKNAEESTVKKIIQRVPPSSFFLKEAKLRGSESNDIVLMAALKGNGQTGLPLSLKDEEEIEEEQAIIKKEKKLEEKILEDELETEIENEEELLLEERNPSSRTSELERERLDEEEVEAEREAVLLEERGFQMPIDHKYTGARRLIHAFVGDDGKMHYEPLSFASGHHNNHNNYHNNHNSYHNNNNHHLTSLLSRCLPAKLHHLIQQCNRDYSMAYQAY